MFSTQWPHQTPQNSKTTTLPLKLAKVGMAVDGGEMTFSSVISGASSPTLGFWEKADDTIKARNNTKTIGGGMILLHLCGDLFSLCISQFSKSPSGLAGRNPP
jgi:hypothetical protein